jgi:hypothetical protein
VKPKVGLPLGTRVITVFFQSVISESNYERKHRFKQIEAIRNFANTLENLYNRLEEEEKQPPLGINDVVNK